MIPSEIKQIKQWSHSYNEKELKRPTHTSYEPDGSLSYDEAIERAGDRLLVGFYVTHSDLYILGDVDHVENPLDPFSELPVGLAHLLRSKKTYSEVSPSGKGIRFILKLGEGENKTVLSGSTFYTKESSEKRETQINIAQPWMTITGNATPYAYEKVDTVSIEELEEIFTLRYANVNVPQVTTVDTSKLPTLSELSTAVMTIPLDQNLRIQRAYEDQFNCTYAHYEFWMKILMGINHYATLAGKMMEGLELALQWSRTDPSDYESDEDVAKHWRSFSETEQEIISYRTVFGVAYKYRLFWPYPRPQSKAQKEKKLPLQPMNTEYANFRALVDYFNIEIHRDEDSLSRVYLTGDEDIIKEKLMMHRVISHYDKYYGPFVYDTLIPAFHILCQEQGFLSASHGHIQQFIKNWLATSSQTVNLTRLYFDTPYEELPPDYRLDEKWRESTTFDKLFSCLRIDHMTHDPDKEEELYKAYYKKWLLGLVRNMYFKDSIQMNNCVLLLTGREQIRKTSHFRYLFPPFLRDMVSFTTHGFATENSMRDVSKLSATSLVLVWDELEQYLSGETESNFKKIIDGNPQKIIDKYETIEKTIKPIAIYGATSNMREFRLGAEGSRRIFHIPVSWVDTDLMHQICWHKLINDMKGEAEWIIKTGQVPWLLNKEQLQYQAVLHTGIRAKSSVDLMLEEVFDFTKPLKLTASGGIRGVTSLQTDRTGRMLSTKEVSDVLLRAGYNLSGVKRVALVKTLERVCGDYTGTRHQSTHLARPACTIKKGQATQHQYKKWVMPPMREELRANLFQKFKQFE